LIIFNALFDSLIMNYHTLIDKYVIERDETVAQQMGQRRNNIDRSMSLV
jgi:hypothetical protein